jgi:8-oxo-dGTP pyrophosphatase MutT (NUDIX family)
MPTDVKKFEKSCGSVTFIKDEGKIKYLVIKNKKGLHWDFPKGHVEGSESEEETAMRETLEETGLNITIVPGFRDVLKYSPKSNVEKTVVFFIAETKSKDIKIEDDELVGAKFLEYAEALVQLTYSSASKLLERANNFIKENKI